MVKVVPEKNKEEWQDRFRHLLKNFRARKKISQAALAEILGVTSGLIGQFESPNSENNRLVSSLSFLHLFASLEGWTLKDFVAFLDQGIEQPGLERWEEDVLEALNRLKLSSRKDFHEMVAKLSPEENTPKLEKILKLAVIAASLDEKKIEATTRFLKEIRDESEDSSSDRKR